MRSTPSVFRLLLPVSASKFVVGLFAKTRDHRARADRCRAEAPRGLRPYRSVFQRPEDRSSGSFGRRFAVVALLAVVSLVGVSPAAAQGPRLVPAAPAASANSFETRLSPTTIPGLTYPEPTFAPSETSTPTKAVELGKLLREGRNYELESRWSDALRHYETSLRRFPHEPTLERRFRNARLHHDVVRRYGDSSFGGLLANNSLANALDVYDEVMVKILAHHVDAPDWKQLVESGSTALEVALEEPAFCSRNGVVAGVDQIEMFRHTLRTTLGPLVVENHEDARNAVYQAALLAEQHLNLPPTATVFEYLCGAASTLDAYSAYLTPNQLKDVYAQIDGNFVGLGIELEVKERLLKIVRVIPGSPAERSGVRSGDLILAVDGQSTSELTTDEAAELLQGEADSVCRLVLRAEGQPARHVSVRREQVEVPSVDDIEMIDESGVAYLRLSCFQKTTSRDLDAALWGLHRKGMRSLVIDLRKNPGGLLVTAVDVVDKFVDAGVIVSTDGRNPGENFTYSAHEFGTWRVPLVVLIDGESASAAEIFAGAIRDHRRGTIVGERSFGKGSVQGIFPLTTDTAGVRLTTAKFYSPNGHAYSDTGVEPDIAVHRTARPDSLAAGDGNDDPVLASAVAEARRLIRSR